MIIVSSQHLHLPRKTPITYKPMRCAKTDVMLNASSKIDISVNVSVANKWNKAYEDLRKQYIYLSFSRLLFLSAFVNLTLHLLVARHHKLDNIKHINPCYGIRVYKLYAS